MATWTFGTNKNTPSWTYGNKNTNSFTFQNKSDVFGGAGYATGLIAPPTYNEAINSTNWSFQTKN